MVNVGPTTNSLNDLTRRKINNHNYLWLTNNRFTGWARYRNDQTNDILPTNVLLTAGKNPGKLIKLEVGSRYNLIIANTNPYSE